MGFGVDLFSATATFASSSFDIGSDLVNSLDFLGHNATKTMSESFYLRHNLTRIIDGTSKANPQEISNLHQIWGALGISIMFFPGIIKIPLPLVYLMHGRNWLNETLKDFDVRADKKSRRIESYFFQVTHMLVCPIAIFLGSFSALCKAFLGKSSEVQKASTVMVGHEAFFESFPQILLQCFTIAYGYEVTTVQEVSILASFFLLARVAIVYDLMGEQKELSFRDTMIHTAKVLPAHVTTIIFRVSAFTITMVFLREWAIVPIFTLYLEILAISYIKYQHVQDPVLRFRKIWFRSLSNLAVLNVYDPLNKHGCEKRRCRNFIILSTITAFVHHIIVMTSIILIVFYYPEHFQHERFEKLVIKPGGDLFFYGFSITYALGISSLVLCLHLSTRVLNLRVDVLEK